MKTPNFVPNKFKFDTIHDYNSENWIISVLGGFIEVKRPLPLFILCKIYNTFCNLLYIFLFAMSIFTMYKQAAAGDKSSVLETMNTANMILVGFLYYIIGNTTRESLVEAVKTIDHCVHIYNLEGIAHNIVKKKVGQIRFIVSLLTKLFIFHVIAHLVFLPLGQFFTITEDTSERLLNPYLLLPICMPFDTRTTFGYILAYLLNALHIFRMFMTVAHAMEVYVSCAFQLNARLETLNYSITNIENRAYKKYINSFLFSEDKIPFDAFIHQEEFKKMICECMKEDIRHHQQIMR